MQKIIFIGGFLLLSIALQAQFPVGIFTSPSNCDGSISLEINGDACGSCELRLFKDRDPSTDPDSPDNAQSVTNGSQATFEGLCEGTYYLVLYNADFDCYYYYDDPVVIEVCDISIVSISKEDENCGNDGSITVNISDSHPSYTYELIKDGSIVQTAISDDLSYTFSDLPDGNYTVNVRNSGSCEVSLSGTQIAEGDNELSITSANSTPSTCEFTNDGTITLSVSGGNGSYSYSWGSGIASGGSPFTITGLAPGTYDITVSSGGCSAVTMAEVGLAQGGACDPPGGDCPELTVNIDKVCSGKFSRTLTANVSGTMESLSYEWTLENTSTGDVTFIGTGQTIVLTAGDTPFPTDPDNDFVCVTVTLDSDNTCSEKSCLDFGGVQFCPGSNRLININSDYTFLAVQPNPFNEQLQLTFNSALNQFVSLRILDVKGRIVHNTKLDLSQGINSKQLNLANLNNGIYQILVQEADGTVAVKKVVKIDN